MQAQEQCQAWEAACSFRAGGQWGVEGAGVSLGKGQTFALENTNSDDKLENLYACFFIFPLPISVLVSASISNHILAGS